MRALKGLEEMISLSVVHWRMLEHGCKLRHYVDPGGTAIYYHSGGRYWRKALLTRLSSHYKPIVVGSTLSLSGAFAATGQIHKIAGEEFLDRLNKEYRDMMADSCTVRTTALLSTPASSTSLTAQRPVDSGMADVAAGPR